MESSAMTLYEMAGGAETMRHLVNAFYPRVARHPALKPVFPEDLTEIREKQYLFLTQFFGGPPLFSRQHGAPMLRARHMRVPVTPDRATAWLSCMGEAMDEIGLSGSLRNIMFERLTKAAHHMVNQDAHGGPIPTPMNLRAGRPGHGNSAPDRGSE